MKAEEIFLAALEKATPAERAAYLDGACRDDPELRAQVEGLLKSHEEAGSFLDGPAVDPQATIALQPILEQPGTVIGRYKLMERIAEGGMGVVYVAQQQEPVRRKVALKIIKPGMDTKEVIARFEAERQALALMDHPNIARVLDAGATESGRPYFVMELVRGIPITDYCDKNHLTPQQRLELFVPVCHAVQHAHQKGIIHRDIKPSNVLVTLHDGVPVPKVIDFGVAKAINQRLTERTIYTGFAHMVGTPLYMSPEQAEMSGLDVDTRSDIYSLGVLLYELLTGTTPFDRQRIRQAAYDELLRIIREEEPPKPSTRVSTLGDTASQVADHRKTEVKKLGQLLRGDLDWIVMKALEKDRTRRYDTANGFANDVHRYLHDEPVTACPPSAAYRFKKFARRNKAAFTTAGIIVVALLLGTVISTWQAIRATKAEHAAEELLDSEQEARREADQARDQEAQQRRAAVEAQKAAETARAHAEKERQRAEANFAKARAAVDEYLNKVTESELLSVPGLQPLRRDLLASAMKFYQDFTQARSGDRTIQADLAAAHYRLGRIQSELGNAKAAKTAQDEAIRLYEALRQQGDKSLSVQSGLAQAYHQAARYEEAVKLCEEILAADPKHADTRRLLAGTYNAMAIADKDPPPPELVLQYHQKALALREGLVKEFPDEPKYLVALGGTVNNLGVQLGRQGKARDALAMFERGAEYFAQAHEKAPQSILWGGALALGLTNVALNQAGFGMKDEALKSFRRAVEVRQKLVFQNPAVPSLRGDLYKAYITFGDYQRQLGDAAEANRSFRAAREVLENIPHDTADELFELAAIYASLAAPAAKPDGAPKADAKESEEFAKLAIETLRKSIAAGYRNVQALKQHGLLGPIRQRPEFKEVLASLEKSIEAENLFQRDSKDEKQKLSDKQQAAKLLRELAEKEPAEVRHQATLAASLRSIGLIQLGQKNYSEAEKSLNEALRLSEPLKGKLANDAAQQVGLIAVRIAFGHVWWETDRRPEGHRVWQECLRELDNIATAHRDDAQLQQAIAEHERTICERYGRLGLWNLAAAHAVRNARLGRTTDLPRDLQFAPLILVSEPPETYRAYTKKCNERRRELTVGGQPRHNDVSHLQWVAGLLPGPAVPADELISVGRQSFKANPGYWFAFALASVLHRAGKHDDALRTLQGHFPAADFRNNSLAMSAGYLIPLVESALGHREAAEQKLREADGLYHGFCAELLASTADRLPPPLQDYWWQLFYAQQLRGQAWEKIRGKMPSDDSWGRLIQARGYWLIGEKEKAEAELAATDAAATKEPDLCLARARLFDRFGKPDRAEAEWQKVVDQAGRDPMPWIHRGRWYAQRGEHKKADADFAKAASLTPDELNKFLEAGWWVVGPYPANLEEFCPPELDPDPSKPVFVIDPKTGLSEKPSPWVSVPSGPEGTVSLSGVPARRDGSSIYALGHVYSPTERAVMLMIHKDQALRVWVNGELIEHRVPGEYPIMPGYGPHRLPIVLHGGRNTILAKSPNPDFTVRIGDTIRDRAIWLAEQERFAEAAQSLGKSQLTASDFASERFPWCFSRVLAVEKDLASSYERLCAELVQTQRSDVWWKSMISHSCALRPNAIFDKHVDQLVSFAEEAALVNYRAKRYERARSFLNQSGRMPYDLPLRSLLEHQAGDAASAAKSLAQAIAAGSKYEEELRTSDRSNFQESGPFWWWYDWAQYLTFLAEAEQTIRGGTTASAKLKRQAEETMAKRWAESPETAPYDHAVLFSARGGDGALKFPQPLIARGKRLAQLKRFAAAEADFNKAVELKPNDPDVLAARAIFYADRGQADKAAADFHAALNLFTDETKPRFRFGVPIDLEVAGRDDVFDRLVALRPNDGGLWEARVAIRVQQGRLEATIPDALRLERNGSFAVPAAVALLRGDRQEFERIRRAAPLIQDPFHATALLGLAPTSGPMTSQLLALGERVLQQDSQSPFHRRLWGLAQLRAGRFKDAVETLEGSLQTGLWQYEACVWPLLAIAHHQLGSAKLARKCLDQTSQWIELGEKVAAADPSHMMGPHKILPWDCVYARVFYREAKELIEGGGKARVAAGSKPQPAPAAKAQAKDAKPPAPKPPAAQAAPTEKPKEKQEKK